MKTTGIGERDASAREDGIGAKNLLAVVLGVGLTAGVALAACRLLAELYPYVCPLASLSDFEMVRFLSGVLSPI